MRAWIELLLLGDAVFLDHDVLDFEENVSDFTDLRVFLVKELLMVFVLLLDLEKYLEVSLDYHLDLGEVHIRSVLLEDIRFNYATDFMVEPLQNILDRSSHAVLRNLVDVSFGRHFGERIVDGPHFIQIRMWVLHEFCIFTFLKGKECVDNHVVLDSLVHGNEHS